MRKIILPLLIAGFITCSFSLKAQNYQFGHINSQELIILMPEYGQANDSLNKVGQRYSLREERLTEEINRKYNELVEQQNDMDSVIFQMEIGQLQDLQRRLQEFQMHATQTMRDLETNLTGRIMTKLESAVSEVATELNLIYVFDLDRRNPIYASDKSLNIAPMVKEKLGLP